MQCIMVTGDNLMTAAHIACDEEIIDRDVLILDFKENAEHEKGGHIRFYLVQFPGVFI